MPTGRYQTPRLHTTTIVPAREGGTAHGLPRRLPRGGSAGPKDSDPIVPRALRPAHLGSARVSPPASAADVARSRFVHNRSAAQMSRALGRTEARRHFNCRHRRAWRHGCGEHREAISAVTGNEPGEHVHALFVRSRPWHWFMWGSRQQSGSTHCGWHLAICSAGARTGSTDPENHRADGVSAESTPRAADKRQ